MYWDLFIYSSSAFSNCVFLFANNPKLLGFELTFPPPCLLETFLDLNLVPTLVRPLFHLKYTVAFQIGRVNEILSNILHWKLVFPLLCLSPEMKTLPNKPALHLFILFPF